MGRSVVVRLVTGEAARGRLAAHLHDVETGVEIEVRDASELVIALQALADASRSAPQLAEHDGRRGPA
jgi:hypothetical protein